MSFEKKLGRLEEIVQKMEKENLELEISLKLFEEGVSLSKECHEDLGKAEKKVKALTGLDDQGNPVYENFESETPEK